MIEIVQNNKNVVIFDSNCLVCNSFIQFINKLDIHNYFLFANFDSGFVKKNNINFDKTTIILYTSNGTSTKSDAILNIFETLHFHIGIVKIIKFLPIKFRDFFYDLFSKNRFVFGKNEEYCSFELKNKILE